MLPEKYAARRGCVEEVMRMRTACFARAPQRCTSRTYIPFLLMFHEVRPISKTRNQLTYITTSLILCRFFYTATKSDKLGDSCLDTFGVVDAVETLWVAEADAVRGSLLVTMPAP